MGLILSLYLLPSIFSSHTHTHTHTHTQRETHTHTHTHTHTQRHTHTHTHTHIYHTHTHTYITCIHTLTHRSFEEMEAHITAGSRSPVMPTPRTAPEGADHENIR